MANRRDGDHHNNDGGDDVNNPVFIRAEFLDFHDENQQFRDSTQQTLCHAPNPVPEFVTMTGMLISSLNLILTRTNLTF